MSVPTPPGAWGREAVGHPAAERELRRLRLTVTRRLDGLLRGQYAGLVPGSGTDFAGSREYHPGEDDARYMDWAVTARTTVPHVRQTIADRELTVWLVVDCSASMDFGTAGLEKRQLATAAVAAVGLLTADAGNRLGADVLGPGVDRRVPARPGRAHLLGLLRRLITAPRVEPGAPVTSLADGLAGAGRVMRRRGLLVVVSDFLDLDTGGWEYELRRLAVRHQVLAVEVLDPRELDLPDVGMLTLVDPETGRQRQLWTGDRGLRDRYATAAARHRDDVRDALRRAGAAHLQLRTDRDWVADIVRHVHAQRRLAGAAARQARPAVPAPAAPAAGAP